MKNSVLRSACPKSVIGQASNKAKNALFKKAKRLFMLTKFMCAKLHNSFDYSKFLYWNFSFISFASTPRAVLSSEAVPAIHHDISKKRAGMEPRISVGPSTTLPRQSVSHSCTLGREGPRPCHFNLSFTLNTRHLFSLVVRSHGREANPCFC